MHTLLKTSNIPNCSPRNWRMVITLLFSYVNRRQAFNSLSYKLQLLKKKEETSLIMLIHKKLVHNGRSQEGGNVQVFKCLRILYFLNPLLSIPESVEL